MWKIELTPTRVPTGENRKEVKVIFVALMIVNLPDKWKTSTHITKHNICPEIKIQGNPELDTCNEPTGYPALTKTVRVKRNLQMKETIGDRDNTIIFQMDWETLSS